MYTSSVSAPLRLPLDCCESYVTVSAVVHKEDNEYGSMWPRLPAFDLSVIDAVVSFRLVLGGLFVLKLFYILVHPEGKSKYCEKHYSCISSIDWVGR